MGEVRNGMGGSGWTKVAGAVRSSTVVVPKVLCEHHMQVAMMKISTRSVSSALRVRTNRSAKQWHCCIEAKNVPAMHQARGQDSSRTRENLNNRTSGGLPHGC